MSTVVAAFAWSGLVMMWVLFIALIIYILSE